MQAALEKELAEVEAKAALEERETAATPATADLTIPTQVVEVSNGDDADMAGTDDVRQTSKPTPKATNAAGDEEDDGSDAESEDLEAESSGSEDEEEDEGENEGEGDGDEDVEMGEDGNQKPDQSSSNNKQGGHDSTGTDVNGAAEVMVH